MIEDRNSLYGVTGKFSIDKFSNALVRSGPLGGDCSCAMLSPFVVSALPSDSHAEEFLASQRIVAKTAKHPAGNQIRIRFMNAARGHAVM